MSDTLEAAEHTGTTPPDLTLTSEGAPRLPTVERRHLLVFSGASSWMYELPSDGNVIVGRSETTDLRIDDASVSRHHARLTVDGDRVTITDLGSQSGTLVNDVEISGERMLHANDVVTIHKTTLIVHTTTTPSPTAAVIEMPAFRERLEAEIERSVRYERVFSVLCVVWPQLRNDQRGNERVITSQLRRIDAATWAGAALYVLLPEASTDDAIVIANQIRSSLDATSLRLGHASCPADGYDVDAMLASAHNAALAAEPGAIGGTSRAFQTLTIGSQRIVVADPVVLRLYALIERLAPVDLPVLITGETGCGKELAATAIHQLSRRGTKAMVSLNCAAIQETLVESELFGHEKGAFSGAVTAKPGLIETANGSTLFLDEIGELAPATQAKLLRVLETHRMMRVGGVREREVDVRIVAATNRDLDAEVAAGRFRHDLFFRLSAAALYLPPLRERPREMPLLASSFLDAACRKNGRAMMSISDGAMHALRGHGWPGNVRELKNLMQYVAAAHPCDVLTAEHITERLGRPTRATNPLAVPTDPVVPGSTFRPIAEEVRDLEITRMREALEATGGNRTRAASLLTMPVRTFFEKAKQYDLSPKKRRNEP